jgi:hypothetical protein
MKKEVVMACYRVSFFNDLSNSNGKWFKCLQRAVVIDSAEDTEDASEKAKREFERLESIPKWEIHAQYFEIEKAARESTSHAQ